MVENVDADGVWPAPEAEVAGRGLAGNRSQQPLGPLISATSIAVQGSPGLGRVADYIPALARVDANKFGDRYCW